jgi:hypothetical protein
MHDGWKRKGWSLGQQKVSSYVSRTYACHCLKIIMGEKGRTSVNESRCSPCGWTTRRHRHVGFVRWEGACETHACSQGYNLISEVVSTGKLHPKNGGRSVGDACFEYGSSNKRRRLKMDRYRSYEEEALADRRYTHVMIHPSTAK